AGAVLLSQLWAGQQPHRYPRRRRQPGVRLGRANATMAVDDRALLVDRPAVRVVLPVADHPPGDGPPRPGPADRASDQRRLLLAVATALYLRTPSAGRPVRLAVRCADGVRQALQPGPVTAHRA